MAGGFIAFQVADAEAQCPTTVETASYFGDRTHAVRFHNDGANTATIYYVNSEFGAIGNCRIAPGETQYLSKRRIFHRFWSSSADVWGVGGYCMR